MTQISLGFFFIRYWTDEAINVGSLNCVPIFFAPATYPPFWNLCTLQDSFTTPSEIADYSGK
jgi:peptidoglycan biosynthesis protein MviN/MurJ (putative lipid II flippase)